MARTRRLSNHCPSHHAVTAEGLVAANAACLPRSHRRRGQCRVSASRRPGGRQSPNPLPPGPLGPPSAASRRVDFRERPRHPRACTGRPARPGPAPLTGSGYCRPPHPCHPGPTARPCAPVLTRHPGQVGVGVPYPAGAEEAAEARALGVAAALHGAAGPRARRPPPQRPPRAAVKRAALLSGPRGSYRRGRSAVAMVRGARRAGSHFAASGGGGSPRPPSLDAARLRPRRSFRASRRGGGRRDEPGAAGRRMRRGRAAAAASSRRPWGAAAAWSRRPLAGPRG